MERAHNPWRLFDKLIEGVPEGIAVTDCCLGLNWAYVQAECGCGISHMVTGGKSKEFGADPRALDLRSLCELSKSWSFVEATLGVAALNAWYSQPDKIEALGGTIDMTTPGGEKSNPFESMQERYACKKITVVGHFPGVDKMFESAEVTVLERNCMSPLDTPDPACEYILPEQDLVFMTGITLINKTMPRLLELSRDATVAVVGPSAIPSDIMREAGANIIAGSVAIDSELAAWAIRSSTKSAWRKSIKKYFLEW